MNILNAGGLGDYGGRLGDCGLSLGGTNIHGTSGNLMPPNQGKRDIVRPRHDLIPIEFLDELAAIFEEGRRPRPGLPDGYGNSWMNGGDEFLTDCLNHASNHLHKFMNGDRTERHLSKVAWNVLCVQYHHSKQSQE